MPDNAPKSATLLLVHRYTTIQYWVLGCTLLPRFLNKRRTPTKFGENPSGHGFFFLSRYSTPCTDHDF